VLPEESPVRSLRWDKDGILHGTCGTNERRSFQIKDGVVSGIELTQANDHKDDAVAARFAHLALPGAPGRQRLAQAACFTSWNGEQQLVGTADGYLALVDASGARVKSLGPVVACGPIRQLVSNQSGTRAFGVAGDARGVGIVFCYDAELGLHQLGWVGGEHQNLIGGPGHSNELSCLALSPDEQTLAVGAADRLGCVYLFTDILIPGAELKKS
jgi:WD40 repeat protein